MSRQPNDYQIRVYATNDGWVDIDLVGQLQYSRSEQGRGLAAMCEHGTDEWKHVLSLCDEVRDAMLALDAEVRRLEDSYERDEGMA